MSSRRTLARERPLDTRTTIVTPEGTSLGVQLGGLTRRALAYAVDLIVEAALLVVVWIAHGELEGGDALELLAGHPWALVGLSVVYHLVFELLTGGRSPGKLLLGLRVLMADGGRMRPLPCVVRNLTRVVDLLPVIGAASIADPFSALLDRRFRRMGDRAAGTLVALVALEPRRPSDFESEHLQELAPSVRARLRSIDARITRLEAAPRGMLAEADGLEVASLTRCLSVDLARARARGDHTAIRALEAVAMRANALVSAYRSTAAPRLISLLLDAPGALARHAALAIAVAVIWLGSLVAAYGYARTDESFALSILDPPTLLAMERWDRIGTAGAVEPRDLLSGPLDHRARATSAALGLSGIVSVGVGSFANLMVDAASIGAYLERADRLGMSVRALLPASSGLVFELLALLLVSLAGLLAGLAMLRPGDRARLDALWERRSEAVAIVALGLLSFLYGRLLSALDAGLRREAILTLIFLIAYVAQRRLAHR
ncbi:MAG: RDD family protein [Deltaproteobacteria bacterium]|nr:RDD family protein [Deltaproteobacteria bacterium]